MEQGRTDFGVFVRLSGMMFLQFAIWGAWAVLIAGHMQNLGFSGTQIRRDYVNSENTHLSPGWR